MGQYHIAFFCIPAHGHLNPQLSIMSRLSDEGHFVTCATGEKFASQVKKAGATITPYKSIISTEAIPNRFSEEDMVDILPTMVDEAISTYFQLQLFYRSEKPDIIVYDSSTLSGRLFSAKLCIPSVQLFPMLIGDMRFKPMRFFLNPSNESRKLADQKLFDFSKQNNLKPIGKFQHIEKFNIAFFPKELQPFGGRYGDNFSFVGPCINLNNEYGRWKEYKFYGKDIVLISLGTTFNIWLDFFRSCVAAFSNTRWHVVISVGQGIDISSFSPIPSNIEIYSYVSHLDVLPRAKLFIGHGGMNSTMEALYYNCPMILIPQTPDQEWIAQRIVDLNLGIKLDRSEASAALILKSADYLLNHPMQPEAMQQAGFIEANGSKLAAQKIEARANGFW